MKEWEAAARRQEHAIQEREEEERLAEQLSARVKALEHECGDLQRKRDMQTRMIRLRDGELARMRDAAETSLKDLQEAHRLSLQEVESLRASLKEKCELNLRLAADLGAANEQVRKLSSGEELAVTARSRDNFKEAYESAKEELRKAAPVGLCSGVVHRSFASTLTEEEKAMLRAQFKEAMGELPRVVQKTGIKVVDVLGMSCEERRLLIGDPNAPVPRGTIDMRRLTEGEMPQKVTVELKDMKQEEVREKLKELGVDIVPSTEKVLEAVRKQKLEMDGEDEMSDFSASQAEAAKAKNVAHAVSQAVHPVRNLKEAEDVARKVGKNIAAHVVGQVSDLSFADVDIDTERERDG